MDKTWDTQKDIDGMTLGGMDACIKSIWNNQEYITDEQRTEMFRLYQEVLALQKWVVFNETYEMQEQARIREAELMDRLMEERNDS